MADNERPRWQHTSAKFIETIKPPNIARRIGAFADWPVMRHGRGEMMSLVYIERPELSAITYSQLVPALEARAKWLDYTLETLEDVRRLIQELENHQMRLETLFGGRERQTMTVGQGFVTLRTDQRMEQKLSYKERNALRDELEARLARQRRVIETAIRLRDSFGQTGIVEQEGQPDRYFVEITDPNAAVALCAALCAYE